MQWMANTPRLFRNLCKSWKCIRDNTWEVATLKDKYRNSIFSCGTSPHDDNDPVLVRLGSFIEDFVEINPKIITHDQLFQRPYIFDPAFEVDCPNLTNDYYIPSVFSERDALNLIEEKFKPDYRWFLIGGFGSGSSLHVDPCHTSAWNAVVTGRKLWITVDPNIKKKFPKCDISKLQIVAQESIFHQLQIDDSGKQYFGQDLWKIRDDLVLAIIQGSSDNRMEVNDAGDLIEVFVQGPGEVLYIPSLWYHAALNIAPTVAITHNFVEHSKIRFFLDAYYNEACNKFTAEEWKHVENCITKKITKETA